MTENTHLSVNDRNHLVIGGCDTTELAAQFGTPLYVMDETAIRENMRMYRDAMHRHYEGEGLVLYASKAFSTAAIYRMAQQEGLGVDVVSGGELFTALQAGFRLDLGYFGGIN